MSPCGSKSCITVEFGSIRCVVDFSTEHNGRGVLEQMDAKLLIPMLMLLI